MEEISKVNGPGFNDELRQRLLTQGINFITTVQRMAIEAGVADCKSLVVCAPTSSGKTLVGEIALLAAINSGRKVLYLVSLKALADQKFDDFRRRYGNNGRDPLARIAIATGDRDDGDSEPQILVATYEKAIALILSGAINLAETAIIADELQILGEDKRGPEIEILCALLRQRGVKQFISLTATVSNGEDISGWLECDLVESGHRDVELVQEIWADGKIFSIRFGQEEGEAKDAGHSLPTNTLDAVERLLLHKRGPVLVFTETRRDASELAAQYASRCTKTVDGYNFAEQLSLFSEATEFSDRLKDTAEAKVAFHTADLTQSERAVVEQGLIDGTFNVCFATPTLAAGVNFPFQTVLFDRIHRRYIPPPPLPIGNYRNMSGRAGRLGMHERGYSILIPRDQIEAKHANVLVLPENERLTSKLISLSVRKIVLSLIASGSAGSIEEIREFLENTLYWYQIRDRNPAKLDELVSLVKSSIEWLITHGMVTQDSSRLIATDLGLVTSRTGLLPSSAYAFAQALTKHAKDLEISFEDFEIGWIHAVCSCDDFKSTSAQRFLPPVRGMTANALGMLRGSRLLADLDSSQESASVVQSSIALFQFMCGQLERRISADSGISSGYLHRLAGDVAWILDGIHHIAGVPSVGCPQAVMNHLSILARRIRYGVPLELVDLIRIAQRANVPGFGRQRALALMKAGLSTPEAIINTDPKSLEQILLHKVRVDSLVDALQKAEDRPYEFARRRQSKAARELGIEEMVDDAYRLFGNEYEDAIEALLRLDKTWKVTKLEDGKRQGVPDFLIQLGSKSAVLECKTCTKKPPAITKDEAFAVLTKAANIESTTRRVTLGKPGFDTFSEGKACGSTEITLVRHTDFIDAMLLLRSGFVTSEEVFSWLVEPGVAEIERLEARKSMPVVQ